MNLSWKGRMYYMRIPAGSILLLYIISRAVMAGEGSTRLFYSLTAALLIIALNVQSILLYRHLLKEKAAMERRNLVLEQQMQLCSAQNAESSNNWNELKKLRHDYTNNLICLREHLKRNNIREAEEYAENLLSNIRGEYGKNKMGNSFVDIFLGYKIKNESIRHIQFRVNVVIPTKLPFDESDICVILGNAFDNAVEAMKDLPEEERFIEVSMEYQKHALKIVLESSYGGELRQDRKGRLISNKISEKNFRIRLASIEETIKGYHGVLNKDVTPDRIKVKILLYEK